MKMKYLILFLICSFSFYYTEKIALNIKENNPIMKNINNISDSLYINSIDSKLIEDKYIIPGLNGKEVNKDKSYNNMKVFEEYNQQKLVYDQIKPKISLEENKNRIIIRGNAKKNSVSLIFEKDNSLTEYLASNKYKINVLINQEEYNLKYELINNSNNSKTFKNIDKKLSKLNKNNNLCYIKNTIPKLCKNKYLFKQSLTITPSNINESINNISSGEIILIKGLNLDQLNLVLKQIQYQDLKVVPLSKLISELNE